MGGGEDRSPPTSRCPGGSRQAPLLCPAAAAAAAPPCPPLPAQPCAHACRTRPSPARTSPPCSRRRTAWTRVPDCCSTSCRRAHLSDDGGKRRRRSEAPPPAPPRAQASGAANDTLIIYTADNGAGAGRSVVPLLPAMLPAARGPPPSLPPYPFFLLLPPSFCSRRAVGLWQDYLLRAGRRRAPHRQHPGGRGYARRGRCRGSSSSSSARGWEGGAPMRLLPPSSSGGSRTAVLASLLDVAPTILDWMQVRAPFFLFLPLLLSLPRLTPRGPSPLRRYPSCPTRSTGTP